MPQPPIPPTRSSLKGARYRYAGEEKKNVTFDPAFSFSRRPTVVSSALHRSFGMQSGEQDDEDDKLKNGSYTTSDEETDEVYYESFENESEPSVESEIDYGYYDEAEEDGYGEEHTFEEPYEDSYLIEMEEKLGAKISAFSPLSLPGIPESNSLKIGRNIQGKTESLRREQGPYKPKLPPKQKLRKYKMKVSDTGSPQLENTVDTRLRKQMEEPDTPIEIFERRQKYRRGLNFGKLKSSSEEQLPVGSAKTPHGPPPPLPDLNKPKPKQPLGSSLDIDEPQIAIYNLSLLVLILFGIFAYANRKEGVQAIKKFPNTLTFAFNNPGIIIPGIASTVVSLPQYIVCSVITCESTTINHLKTVTMIAADTTLDLAVLKDFANLMASLGKPLILDVAGNELAAEAKDHRENHSREIADIIAIEELAQAFQEANTDLWHMVRGTYQLIKITTKKWSDFSGLLTDQIPKVVRDEIDLPRRWTIGVPASRKKRSTKALKTYYGAARDEMAISYRWLHPVTETCEKSLSSVLKQAQELHEGGVYELGGILKAIEPLMESIAEIRRHVAFQIKFFGSNDDRVWAEIGKDKDFKFEDLKWKVESLWTSVALLQDSVLGKAARITLRHLH